MEAFALFICLLLVLVVSLGVHFIPAIVAHKRKHQYRGWVLVANILLGWTGLGWLAVLAWAIIGPAERFAVELPSQEPGCRGCSQPLRPGAKFCPHCGTPVAALS